jgi:DNA (cytosine-5)-methyltransferase 1
MRVGSLFTGYGGLDMAINGDLAWYCEIEPAACRVLEAHYPGVPNLGDITKINWDEVEPVDIITGGYPCQPFSHAGNRKGKNDERHLWPFVRDAIRTLRPGYAILENVAGHLTLGFGDVLADLAAIGWDAEWTVVRASDVGACHRRARLFILAYPNIERLQRHNGFTRQTQAERQRHLKQGDSAFVADSDGERHGGWEGSREVAGMDTEDAGQPQQRERSRQEFGTRSDQPAADTDSASSKTFARRQRGGDFRRLQPMERGGQVDSFTSDTSSAERRRKEHEHLSEAVRTATESGERVSFTADTDDGHGETVGPMPRLERHASRRDMHEMPDTDWGQYTQAIRRWENTIGRPAPAPTIVGRANKPRLNPEFVEWMMGLPSGWVTGHNLSPAQCLKMLGNGVVPQQARHAIQQLTERTV